MKRASKVKTCRSCCNKKAINACLVLNAKPVFAGQVDGDTMMDNAWLSKIQELVYNEKPDVVLTHRLIDSHKDHQVASLLTIQSWLRAQK